MLEDFRNHDPNPTAQERAWMSVNPFPVVLRLIVLAGLAVAIGLSASQSINPPQAATVAATAP